MIISITLIVIVGVFDIDALGDSITFWLEAITNAAFGISWLVKGNGIRWLND